MFGQAPATSPFGAPAPAPFGAPAPAFGAAPAAPGGFGAPAAVGGFGAPAVAPAAGGFGQPAAVAGGFGQPAAAPVGFGAAPATAGAFGQPAAAPVGFGAAPAAPGGFGAPAAGGFGAPAPAAGGMFGAAPTPAPFGSPAPAPAFGAKPAGGGLFGAAPAAPAGGLFGAAPAPAAGGMFGGAPSAGAFGAPAPATPFGAPAAAPAFGAAPAPAFGAPAPAAGGFGAAPAAGGFGQPQQAQAGSTMAPYNTTSKQDGTNTIILQAITAMPQYEAKSFEELRLEDYLAGNKGTKGAAPVAPAAGFGGFGAAPAPAFGQPAAAPAFGAPAPAAGGLFGSAPTPAPAGGLFGAPAPAAAFGQPAAPAFGAAPAPAAGGLFGAAPAAPAFGQPAAAPAFGAAPAPAAGGLFGGGAPAPAPGGLFGATPAPAFGQPAAAPAFGAAPAPAAGGLFGAPAPAPVGGGLFGAPAPAPAAGGLFGAPAPAAGGLFGAPTPAPATGGLFGAPTPAKPGGLFGAPAPAPVGGGLFGAPAMAPAAGGLFGAPAPVAGGLYGAAPAAPTVPVAPPPSAEAVLAQQLAAVENQKKQLELLEAWRGNPPSGSKVVPTSQYDGDSGTDWNGSGGSSYAASSSALLSYRAGPRSTAKIRPRGYTPTQRASPVAALGRKTGSPILSPNRFVGSATKTLFIKPNSLTPKPKTRLLLTNGVSNGGHDPIVAALENGKYESPNKTNIPSQQLNNSSANGGSQPKPVDSVSPVSPRAAGSPATPAHDFYNQVVDSSNNRSPSAPSPSQPENICAPNLTKTGYNVYPSIEQLEAMSEADLAAVSDFKVERPGYGSVAWDGAVDVRGVDIDAVVVIESKNVSVYDEAEEKGEKPQRGSKLNRPAVITMVDIYPKDGPESSAEAKDKLKRKIEKSTKKMGAELLSFDSDSGVWKFRVGHFSRYGLDDSDEDSDEDVQATPLLSEEDEQESANLVVDETKELGGASRMCAPMDEDESTSGYTDMSATDTLDQSESEGVEEMFEEVQEIVREGEEAYEMMTEEVFEEYEEAAAIVPFEPLENEVEEEELLYPEDSADNVNLPAKQPLMPTGPISCPAPSAGICSKLARKSGLPKSSNIDFGMRMRRSFRVGWRPDGSFIQLRPSSSGAQVLVQSRPDISPPSSEEADGKDSSMSLPLLRTHQKHSTKAVVETEDEAPIFTLPRSIGSGNDQIFNALEDYSKSSSICSSNSSAKQVVPNAFSLLVSLYSKEEKDGSVIDKSRRIKSVSSWLKGVVTSDTKKAISAAQSSGDTSGSIFAALSGGDVSSASSLALDTGNPRLSLMLATASDQAQPFFDDQLKDWNKSGAQQFAPTGLLRIFSLASGSIDCERVLYKSNPAMYKIDWRRRFGMYLWSCAQSKDQNTLSSIVQQYGSDVSGGLAPPAKPSYCDNATQSSNECILYQMLNHYEDANMPLADIVSPSSHTPSQHDFSSSFHLCASMTAISSSSLTSHQENLIVNAIISQLIGEGLWEWSVYVSLCFIGSGSISESLVSARQLQAKQIISRFYAPSIDPSAGSRRSFLQSIGIPPQWFSEAHAYRSASEGDVFGMVDNFMVSSYSASESMAAMERLVIPSMILEGKQSEKQLWQLLESLRSKISDDCDELWNTPSACGTFHQFLQLKAQVEDLSKEPMNEAEGEVDDLLAETFDLETTITNAADKAVNKSSLPFTKVQFGFNRVPHGIVLSEVGAMLSSIRMELLAMKSGQPARKSGRGSTAFAVTPGGLYDSSMGSQAMLRGFCGYQAMS